MTYQARTTTFKKTARALALALVTLWMIQVPAMLMAQAKPGEEQAKKIAERVEAQETKSSAQEDLVKEVADAAKKAGENNPNDADAVKKEVKDKIDDIINRKSGGGKHGGANNKEIRDWAKKLKRDLMDGNYFAVVAGAKPGEEQGEKIAERVESEETTSSAQEDLVEEIADTARKAGKDNPNDPQKVKDAVKTKLDEIRDRPSRGGTPGGKNNKEISDWVKRLKRTLMGGSYVSIVPPNGSRLLMTGTVVANEPATLAVVDAQGSTLQGVVVDIDDERYVSDENGRVTFVVASTTVAVVASMPALLSSPVVEAQVVPAPISVAVAPHVDPIPPHVAPGDEITFSGSGFDGAASGNTIELSGNEVPVLASSPTEIVAMVPEGTPFGPCDVTVATDQGVSDAQAMNVVGMSLHADSSVLRRGERRKASIVIEGSDQPITLEVTNRSPNTITLGDAETVTLQTSGGRDNRATFKFRGVHPGSYSISAHIQDVVDQPTRAHSEDARVAAR